MRTITVQGATTQYTDTGNGPVLLCVHGWMYDHTSFDLLAKELEDSFRVISLDLPNFGGSPQTTDITSLKEYAEFLAAFADDLKLSDYSVMGHSMGGQIVLYATAHKILQPKYLILLAASGVRSLRPLKRKILQALAVPSGYFVPPKLRPKFYKLLQSDYSPNLSKAHKQVIKKILKKDIAEDATLITVPTLLIFGQDDIFTTPAMGKVLHRHIADSRLEVLANQRHRLQQTAPKEVAKLVKGFMK